MCFLQNRVRCGKGPRAQSFQCQFTESDLAHAVLLMARSGSGNNCGSAGKNQTHPGQSSMLTLLASFCLAEMQTPSCLTKSEGTTSSCFDTCLSDTSVT